MKNKTHSCSNFSIIPPIGSIDTAEDGIAGYIRSKHIIIYKKDVRDKKIYFRIFKYAPIYDDFVYESNMISISKVDNIIEIEVDPENFFFTELGFHENSEQYTEESRLSYKVYDPYFLSEDVSEETDQVRIIITQTKDITTMHQNTVDYIYNYPSDKIGISKLIELVPPKIEYRLKHMEESDIKAFKTQTIKNIDELEETKQELENKVDPGKSKIEQLTIYLNMIKESINNVFIDEEDLMKLQINDLIDIHKIETNLTKKSIIEKVLTKKCQGG